MESKYPDLEEVLPLSPLQEGLLFHALYDAQAPDVYTVQLALDLEGLLEEDVLKAAVRTLLQRHSSLRVGFLSMKTSAGRCRSLCLLQNLPGIGSISHY